MTIPILAPGVAWFERDEPEKLVMGRPQYMPPQGSRLGRLGPLDQAAQPVHAERVDLCPLCGGKTYRAND